MAACLSEEWRPVYEQPSFSEPYEVSNCGRVRNTRTGRILALVLTHKGYLRVGLRRASRSRMVFVHKLVALAFIGPRPTGLQINHKNGVKTDNCIHNLEYVSCQENIIHSYRVLGVVRRRPISRQHPPLRPSRPAKRRQLPIQSLKADKDAGMTYREISHKYLIPLTTVYRVISTKKAQPP